MARKTNVLIYPTLPVANACDLYRTINPFKYSNKIESKIEYEIKVLQGKTKEGQIVRTIDRESIKWSDIVVLNRYYTKEKLSLLDTIIKVAKAEGKKIIYETDDLLHKVDDNTSEYIKETRKIQHEENMKSVDMCLEACDIMTVSTDYLKAFYQRLLPEKQIYVLNNYYDPETWDKVKIKPNKTKKFRIGWAGGENHYHTNFSILEEPLNYIKKKYKNDVTFCVMSGKHPNQDWFPGHINKFDFEFEYFEGETLEDYPQALANMKLDLGLVVVQDNEFSRAKSNIKWMEYALCDVPCIASDVQPYKSTTALLTKNDPDSWIKSLELMMTNHEKYSIIKQETSVKVKDFSIKNHFHKWEKVYSTIVNN